MTFLYASDPSGLSSCRISSAVTLAVITISFAPQSLIKQFPTHMYGNRADPPEVHCKHSDSLGSGTPSVLFGVAVVNETRIQPVETAIAVEHAFQELGERDGDYRI